MTDLNHSIKSRYTDTELVFVGLGLVGFKSCSFEVFQVLEATDIIFLEKYTNFILDEVPPQFQNITQKIIPITRQELEEDDEKFFKRIIGRRAVLLIPGDPFIGTTHISLRITAKEKGIHHRTIHNTSILSAAISTSGLSMYRFGRTVTCPFPQNPSEYPYDIIKNNQQINAHTLVLLDVNPTSGDFLPVDQALSMLLDIEHKNQTGSLTEMSLIIGLARLGYKEEMIRAGTLQQVMDFHWKTIGAPQCLIICAKELHFAEKQALETIWNVHRNLTRDKQ